MKKTSVELFGKGAWNLLGLGLILLVAGCGGGQQQSTDGGQTSTAPAYRATLPPLDAPLPPLDDGRVVVAGPKGWYYPPRSAKYVFRVQRSADRGVPLIALTAEDATSVRNLTRETVGEFIRQLAEEHQKSPASYVQRQVGNRMWVAYRRRGREPGRVGVVYDILVMETVVAGRRYTLRLVCEPNELDQWEPYVRAVAAGMRFTAAEELVAAAEPSVPAGGGEASGATAPAKPAAAEGATSVAPSGEPASKPAETKPPAKPPAKPEKPKPAEDEIDLEALEEILR